MFTSARWQISLTVAPSKPFSAKIWPAVSSNRCCVSSRTAIAEDLVKRMNQTSDTYKCIKRMFYRQEDWSIFTPAWRGLCVASGGGGRDKGTSRSKKMCCAIEVTCHSGEESGKSRWTLP